jgi:hypothetical protein
VVALKVSSRGRKSFRTRAVIPGRVPATVNALQVL